MRTRICAHRARGCRRRGKRKQPFSRHRKCGILSPSWGFACYTTASLNNMSGETPVRYSIVVPFFNEQENIPALYMRLTEVMDGLGEPYEIVFVDDGSRDESYKVLEDIFEHDRRGKVARLGREFGQTGALQARFDFARGGGVVSMGGGLPHDPAEIPEILW